MNYSNVSIILLIAAYSRLSKLSYIIIIFNIYHKF